MKRRKYGIREWRARMNRAVNEWMKHPHDKRIEAKIAKLWNDPVIVRAMNKTMAKIQKDIEPLYRKLDEAERITAADLMVTVY